MYVWPQLKLHLLEVKNQAVVGGEKKKNKHPPKKALWPLFLSSQIISFQLRHNQHTLTGVHSCFNQRRLPSRYNILCWKKRTFCHFTFTANAVHKVLCFPKYLLYFDMYIFIRTYITYTYKCCLSVSYWQPVPSAPGPNGISRKNPENKRWLVAGCHSYFLLVILSPSKLLRPSQEHTANWINYNSSTMATIFSRTSVF